MAGICVRSVNEAEGYRIVQIAVRQPTGEPKGAFAVWMQCQSTAAVKKPGTAPNQWWSPVREKNTAPDSVLCALSLANFIVGRYSRWLSVLRSRRVL